MVDQSGSEDNNAIFINLAIEKPGVDADNDGRMD